MRVYAESNFVLEIILEQEQYKACEDLVMLAAEGAIELVLPAFALLEPYQTIKRREIDGRALSNQIDKNKKDLARRASLAAELSKLSDASALLLRAEQDALRRFGEVRTALLDKARLVTIDAVVLRLASTTANDLGLPLPDALVLASVLADAAAQPPSGVALFLNRNTKDFDDPDVRSRLKQVGCDLINGFDEGLARVRASLPPPIPGA